MNVERGIELKGDSKTEEVKISVNEKAIALDIAIASTIKSGQLHIELYSPDGKRKGDFSVGSQIEQGEKALSKSEKVSGKISKHIPEPELGDWVIKIIPEQAHGQLFIKSNFRNK
jgi:subtilisin-like proprotein convertase family protein